MKPVRSRWSDLVALGFFVLTVGIFFRQTFFEGKLPIPSDALVGLYHPWRDLYSVEYPRGVPFKNFLITDPVRQQIPWRKISIDQWKQGQIPLWNPYNFSGTPILANIQSATLYPLNILFLVFPFIDAWMMLIVLQPLLGGLFMYWYLRSLTIRPIASLLGAIAWSFSGFNVAWLTWGTMGHVALWLPLALLSIDKILVWMSFPRRRESISRSLKNGSPIRSGMTHIIIFLWSMIFVGSLVSQFFAGHAQISFYLFLFVISYGVMRILQAKERKSAMLVFIFLLSLVVLSTAVQWMPLLDWIRQSGRVMDSTDWMKEGWFIPWAHLIQFVAPDFFGNPTTLNYWGQWNYGEFVGYIGIVPLAFAFIAIVSRFLKKHLFWIGASVVALLFALPTPIAYLPFILKVPIISALQPTRLLFIVDFVLAILAAYGCHEFLEISKKRRIIWPLGVLAVVFMILWGVSVVGSLEVSIRNLLLPTVLFFASTTLLIIYQRVCHVTMFRNIVTWSIVGLAVVDILRFGWKFTPFTPREYFFPETAVISFLKEQKKPFRVMSVDKRILPPNTLSYYGIESIEGYDPVIASRYEELMAAVARGKPDISPPFGFNRIITLENLDTRLLRIFGVRFVLSLEELKRSDLYQVFQEGETRVYEIASTTPRAYLAERYLVRNTKQNIINVLFDPLFESGKHAVVEEPIPVLQSTPLYRSDRVDLIAYTPSLIDMVSVHDIPRLLVVSNTYASGWRVLVDGKQKKLLKVNYVFQGVVVPSGRHTVRFLYRPF